MIRVTTNGTLRGYKTSLNRSSTGLNAARDKVLSQRNFNSYAEDPAAAAQAFQLRRAFARANSQLDNSKSVLAKYQLAWSSLNTVKSDLTEAEGKVSAEAALSEQTGSGRGPLANVLKSAAESIVQVMNTQYGDAFVFAGSDALNGAPFKLENGVLTYRGVKVDAAAAAGSLNPEDPDVKKILDEMNAETTYMDVGSGLTELNGEIVPTSAFNAALSGLEFLGYGTDDDGYPNNVVSIMLKLSDIFGRCDKDTGAYEDPVKDKEDAQRLFDKLNDALSTITNQWSEMSADSTYLESNVKNMTTQVNNLNEQILDIEQVNMADAITDFSWAQYCYNAALKVGNNILSQSLIDYMN